MALGPLLTQAYATCPAFLYLVAALSGCNPSYDLGGPPPTNPTYGPSGATYAVKVNASGAPAGVVVSFATLPTTISVNPSTVTVGTDGTATAYALVPYGTSGVVLASTPFAAPAEFSVSAAPLLLPCMYWSAQGDTGLYQVSAVVQDDSQPVQSASVAFSVLLPAAGAATVVPAAPLTNAAGVATSIIAVPDAGSLPIVVAAVAGPSALTMVIDNGQSGDAGVCP